MIPDAQFPALLKDARTGLGRCTRAAIAALAVSALLFPSMPARAQCPAAPTLNGTLLPCDGAAQLSWSPDGSATGWEIHRSTSPGGFSGSPIATVSSSTTNYTDIAAPQGVPLYYRVRGRGPSFVCPSGVGSYSSTLSLGTIPTEPLTPVSNFTATPACGAVNLSWSSYPFAVGYLIEVFNGTTLVHSVTQSATSYQHPVPTGAPALVFIVRPFDVCDRHGPMAVQSASPLPNMSPVTGLTSTPGCGRATLSWNPSAGASAYWISYPDGTGTNAFSTSDTSIEIAALVPKEVSVTPVGGCGTGNLTATVTATPLPSAIQTPITGLTVTPQCGAVGFAWNAVSGASGYRVLWQMTVGGPWRNLHTWNNFLQIDLVQGGVYVSIAAVDSCGVPGPAVDGFGALIGRLPEPAWVTAEAATQAGAWIRWAPVPGATGYVVYRTINNVSIIAVTNFPGNAFFDCGVQASSTSGPVSWSVAAINTCSNNGLYGWTEPGILPDLKLISAPETTRVQVGQTASMSVNVVSNTAQTLSYQWRRNGQPLTNTTRISGATSATLSITGSLVADTDTYEVVVTQGNSLPLRLPATLIVTKPCAADFDDSGSIGTQDIFDFLNAWFAGCP